MQQITIPLAMRTVFTPSILRARLGLSLAALALAGCVPVGMNGNQVGQSRTTLTGPGLTIAAPTGWCVDPKSLKNTSNGGFVLFGNCAAISENPNDARAPEPALLSATIGPPAVEDKNGKLSLTRLKGMDTFFHSEIGRAALARSGESKDVKIESSRITGDMLLLRISDRSTSGGPPTARTYLRAITDIKGRIAALSVMPLKNGEMSASAQRNLIERFAATIRAAN